jgi:hypothetical protein
LYFDSFYILGEIFLKGILSRKSDIKQEKHEKQFRSCKKENWVFLMFILERTISNGLIDIL